MPSTESAIYSSSRQSNSAMPGTPEILYLAVDFGLRCPCKGWDTINMVVVVVDLVDQHDDTDDPEDRAFGGVIMLVASVSFSSQ